MSGHDYLKQKLFEALHDLVSDGDLDKRLTYAGSYLVHLHGHDIPEKYQAELDTIRNIMFATPLSSEKLCAYTPRQLSDDDARALARRILSLYTDVMGGL